MYVVLPGGVYIYEAFAHSLSLVAALDARKVTGYQDFVDQHAARLRLRRQGVPPSTRSGTLGSAASAASPAGGSRKESSPGT